MEEEIVNKVSQSGLVTIDLEAFYPQGERVLFDIKDLLFQGLILREKDFREYIKNEDWNKYKDKYVHDVKTGLTCASGEPSIVKESGATGKLKFIFILLS